MATASNHHKIQVTKQGYQELVTELEELKNTKRPHVVARLSNARDQGDLSENSDYISARDELSFVDGRITELEEVIANAEVIPSGKAGAVNIGKKVTVKVSGTKHTFQIVGEWEADPKAKKISHQSPLGQALLGKKVGDKVEVEAPAGKIQYHIIEIE